MDFYKSLQPLFLACLPNGRKETEKLRTQRLNLQRDIYNLIDEYGPKLIENFNDIRLVSHKEAEESTKFGEKLDLGEETLSTRKRIFNSINHKIFFHGNVSATEAEIDSADDNDDFNGNSNPSTNSKRVLMKSYRRHFHRSPKSDDDEEENEPMIKEVKYIKQDAHNTDVEEYTKVFSKKREQLQRIKNQENYNDSEGGLSSYTTTFRKRNNENEKKMN